MIGLRTRHAQLSIQLQRAFSAAFFLCFFGFNFSAMAETPLVPIPSYLYHWDHHWYIWLPGDPVYEAVEIMAAERPKSAPLVWVFFTERNPPKHQTHYFNDAQAAAAGGGQVSDIAFKMTGAEGRAARCLSRVHQQQGAEDRDRRRNKLSSPPNYSARRPDQSDRP
jgi:hypothetical protein